MTWYIKELSKYAITFFLLLYTIEGFAVFRFKDIEQKNGVYIRQNIYMFAIHTLGFITLYVLFPDILYLFLCAFELVLLFSVIVLMRALYPASNRLTINNMCMLLSLGFMILARISLTKAANQLKIVVVALIIGIALPHFVHRLKLLKYLTWVYAMTGIAALGIVLFIGAVTNGSKLSFRILGYSFQPSEFVKILYVFFLAGILYESQSFLRILLSAVLAGAHVLILVLSKDLGSALIFFVVYVCLVFIATRNYIYLSLGVLAGVGASMVAYHFFTHVQIRVQAWQNPWNDLAGTGYQITQSLFALGTGGWFGLGLGQGTPSSIPYAETDFVFSAIGEEMGMLAAFCVIAICFSSFIMCMRIAGQMQDTFYKYIAAGLGIIYIFQVFLTIGGGTKFIPLTGVTLPFISYGGSSMISVVMMFAIIQGLYIIRQEEGERLEKNRKRSEKNRRKEPQRAPLFEDEPGD